MATLTIAAARAYQHSFDAHPNITLAVAGGCLNALGDCVAQIAETVTVKDDRRRHERRYDYLRTMRFFCYGFAISPLLGRWNSFLEARFPLEISASRLSSRVPKPIFGRGARARIRGPEENAGSAITAGEKQLQQQGMRLAGSESNRVSLVALSKRVAADQLIMAPIGLAIFLGSMGVMEGRTGDQIRGKYRDLYGEAIIANWKVWPLAQLINFRYMPLPYRVPFSQTCGVFWTLYLSLLNSREDKKQDLHTALVRQKEEEMVQRSF